MSKKELGVRYIKVFNEVRHLLNQIDTEYLQPGGNQGSPVNEYDQETTKIVSLVLNQPEITKSSLTKEIEQIWIESFGGSCTKSEVLAERILLAIEKL